ncbi:unnamed protein product [Cyprideis torosa]|uniref:Uncharacterized protein n=1 Tax=Cyprideis torosa TaxID=163714 RepID=A0A7R8W1L8_9CRUS|nr:unnamed protein product [Cyprideis torosa]CAG0880883.1 unnamed protein product [Cyprideis torosa]
MCLEDVSNETEECKDEDSPLSVPSVGSITFYSYATPYQEFEPLILPSSSPLQYLTSSPQNETHSPGEVEQVPNLEYLAFLDLPPMPDVSVAQEVSLPSTNAINNNSTSAEDFHADSSGIPETKPLDTEVPEEEKKIEVSEIDASDVGKADSPCAPLVSSTTEDIIPAPRERRTRKSTHGKPSKPRTAPKTYHKCPDCPYVSNRKNNLRRHIRTMHTPLNNPQQCCGLWFLDKFQFRSHLRGVHPFKTFTCHDCQKVFKRRTLLLRHQLGTKNFTCEICDYATNNKSNLQRHINIHKRNIESTLMKVKQEDNINWELTRDNCNLGIHSNPSDGQPIESNGQYIQHITHSVDPCTISSTEMEHVGTCQHCVDSSEDMIQSGEEAALALIRSSIPSQMQDMKKEVAAEVIPEILGQKTNSDVPVSDISDLVVSDTWQPTATPIFDGPYSQRSFCASPLSIATQELQINPYEIYDNAYATGYDIDRSPANPEGMQFAEHQ